MAAHREDAVVGRLPAFLADRTAVPLRGMIWTCELIDEPWVTALLGDIAVSTGISGSGAKPRSERLANAAIGTLERRGGLEIVAQLARVQAKVRKKSILAGVTRTLQEYGFADLSETAQIQPSKA